MAKPLIIVESPTKAKSLRGYFGSMYDVEASGGHVRDLPQYRLGVDVEKDFTPTYETLKDRKDILEKLKKAAAGRRDVYLATDPDREGEAIAWHLKEALGLKHPHRITFGEVTKKAVAAALEAPRELNDDLVEAQETRRVLDRLVGYRLSPLLSKKIQSRLSAGRVQSVAVRLICDREREIAAFKPEEYWSITANLSPQAPQKRFPFEAKLVSFGKKKVPLANQQDADKVLADLNGARWVVAQVKPQERRRNAQPPFITSTLQMEAGRKLGFDNRRTMRIAQQLYEGIDLGSEGTVGLITYMRTDSVRVSPDAQTEAAAFVKERYGSEYLPASPNIYKTKSAAQDAHEAIRPTSVLRTPEEISKHLTPEQLKLYRLIWQRFVASQMAPAVFDVTTVDIDANGYTFRATGSVMRFEGFMKVYLEGRDTDDVEDEDRAPLPVLLTDQQLDLLGITPKQHFTEPPPRYTQPTLVKTLEDREIGRPSTFANIISTILDRGYVVLEDKKFKPTELGFKTNDLLVANFPDLLNVQFTAEMENRLDAIERGETDKVALLRDFYEPFDQLVTKAFDTVESIKPKPVETDIPCPNCGKPMLKRASRNGEFLGCSGYPKCKTTMTLAEAGLAEPEAEAAADADAPLCPDCGKPMQQRRSRFGVFWGCSGYPECRKILQADRKSGAPKPEAPPVSITVPCPKCKGEIQQKRSRRGMVFYGCANYPTCDFTTWHRPLDRPCPQCGWPLGAQSFRGRENGTLKCTNGDCDFTEKPAAASNETAA
jgi:DNA topoisomerase-1